jgi:hypothetical protein
VDGAALVMARRSWYPDLSFDESSTSVLDSRAGHPWSAEALI